MGSAPQPKRLIEVAFPLREVNAECGRGSRGPSPAAIHPWWARRPLPACRAVAMAALVPDPDDPACPPAFRSLVEELVPSAYDSYDREGPHPALRRRLLGFVADLCRWENSNNQRLLEIARRLIREANGGAPPRVLDPFAGGGSIPLEALRLGCEAHASELNPVAVLILKCTVEYPQRYGQPNSRPVPDYIHEMDRREAEASGRRRLTEGDGSWAAAYRRNPLATDIRYWAHWVQERLTKELDPYYTHSRDGRRYVYLWARTVRCPNPRCDGEIPMLHGYWLSNGKVALQPVPQDGRKALDFRIVSSDGLTFDPSEKTLGRTAATCLLCGQTMPLSFVQSEGEAGRLGERMIAIHTREGGRGGDFRAVTEDDLTLVEKAGTALRALDSASGEPLVPHEELPYLRSIFNVHVYGMRTWGALFNPRQAYSLARLTALIRGARDEMHSIGIGDAPYANALASYLALGLGKTCAQVSRVTRWRPDTMSAEANVGAQHDIRMVWDYAELDTRDVWQSSTGSIARAVETVSVVSDIAEVTMCDARQLPVGERSVSMVFTDPPYYDSVPYADLSDFFYVWLKRAIRDVHPELFRTPLTPKPAEIVELAGRNERYAEKDKEFFERELFSAFKRIFETLETGGVAVVLFAHKQTEAWETLVEGLVSAGVVTTASIPIHTEQKGRLRAQESAALQSSVFLLCRPRSRDAGVAYLHEVSEELRSRIRERLDYFWAQGIRGADFFVSAIGPALEVYSRHAEVRTTAGDPVTVKDFLELVRKEVVDYALAQVLHNGLGAVDNETRFYVLWRWAYGSAPLEAGEVITFVKPLGVELDELVRDGVVSKKGSKITLKSAADRSDDEDLGLPRAGVPAPIVDCIHRCLNLWRANRRQELADYLATLGEGRVDLLKRCAQALSEVLREDDSERRDLHAMLTGGLEPSTRRLL